MRFEEIIARIETEGTKILQAEYNDDKAYLRVDEVTLSSIDDIYYTILFTCGHSNKDISFAVDSVAGLPPSFLDFNEQEVFTFTVVVVNIALKMLDYSNEAIEDPNKYIA